MSSNPKLDLHPDAESLSAFAEQALGERERGQIVAHLAECGRCREVVYLAKQAAVEMEPELAVAAATPARQPRTAQKKEPRRWNWRLVWVPVGALAVMVSVAYVVHVRQVEIAGEQAKAARQAEARSVEIAAAPEAAQMEMKAAPSPAGHAPTAAKELRQEPPGNGVQQRTAAAEPAPMRALEASAESNREKAALPGTAGAAYPAMSAASAPREEEPAMVATQDKQGLAADALQYRSKAAGAPQEALVVKPAVHKATGGMLATAARSAQVDANREPAGGVVMSGQPVGGGVFALGRAKLTPLPSGLPAVSTTSAKGLTVAMDAAGGVFVSEDGGGKWESVTKQWSGRAASVRLQAAAAGESVSNSAGRVFEIVNDQGQVWVSTDGRNWKEK